MRGKPLNPVLPLWAAPAPQNVVLGLDKYSVRCLHKPQRQPASSLYRKYQNSSTHTLVEQCSPCSETQGFWYGILVSVYRHCRFLHTWGELERVERMRKTGQS